MNDANRTSFIFEVSNGCQLKCSGCTMDKHSTSFPPPQVIKSLTEFFSDFALVGSPLSEIEIGPTDMMSASNRDEIFASPELKELVSKFRMLTIFASFIQPHEDTYRRFAEQVHGLGPDNVIGLAVPMEMSKVFNDKYIQTIKTNIELFEKHLDNEVEEVVLIALYDDKYISTTRQATHTHEELFERIHSLALAKTVKIDFAFQHGRGHLDHPLRAAEFLSTYRELNKNFQKYMQKEDFDPEHLPSQFRPSADAGEILYHRGLLYIRPVLNERLTVLHDSMRLLGNWSIDNYILQMAARYDRNLALAKTFEDCSSCRHQELCAQRHVHELMQLTHTKRCITMLKPNKV